MHEMVLFQVGQYEQGQNQRPFRVHMFLPFGSMGMMGSQKQQGVEG